MSVCKRSVKKAEGQKQTYVYDEEQDVSVFFGGLP